MSAEVVHLDEARSRKFLRDIANNTFITFVVHIDGTVTVYTRGIEVDDPNSLRIISDTIKSITE